VFSVDPKAGEVFIAVWHLVVANTANGFVRHSSIPQAANPRYMVRHILPRLFSGICKLVQTSVYFVRHRDSTSSVSRKKNKALQPTPSIVLRHS
jgi:hypothetical protein